MADPTPVNIRNFSVKCGHCDEYQTLVAYRPAEESNVYVYECENDLCRIDVTRTLIEVPAWIDEFATRDPEWEEGRRHTGGKAGGSTQ